jgi:hypothetical protein
MSPTDKNKDTNSRHRSFKGCWTCKKKRIQCDEIRPACTKCTSRGIICEGYEIRLRWGAGIASRGKYSGAEKPVKESIPPRSKRRWDMRGKGEHFPQGDGQGQPILVPQHTLKGNIIRLLGFSKLTCSYRSRPAAFSCAASNGEYTQLAVGAGLPGAYYRNPQAF